jgi:hypothetical protein
MTCAEGCLPFGHGRGFREALRIELPAAAAPVGCLLSLQGTFRNKGELTPGDALVPGRPRCTRGCARWRHTTRAACSGSGIARAHPAPSRVSARCTAPLKVACHWDSAVMSAAISAR